MKGDRTGVACYGCFDVLLNCVCTSCEMVLVVLSGKILLLSLLQAVAIILVRIYLVHSVIGRLLDIHTAGTRSKLNFIPLNINSFVRIRKTWQKNSSNVRRSFIRKKYVRATDRRKVSMRLFNVSQTTHLRGYLQMVPMNNEEQDG